MSINAMKKSVRIAPFRGSGVVSGELPLNDGKGWDEAAGLVSGMPGL
jgi:hypothetical protein